VALPIVIGRHPVFLVTRPSEFGPAHPVYLDLAGGSYARPETGGLTITGSLTDDEAQHPRPLATALFAEHVSGIETDEFHQVR